MNKSVSDCGEVKERNKIKRFFLVSDIATGQAKQSTV